jgi:Carboxypeptidase regulatory-like domain
MNPSMARSDLWRRTLLLFLLLSTPMWGQDGGTILSGTITGPSGAVIPNAKVLVKNPTSGQSIETQASLYGMYSVSNLTPGDYEVSVSAEGFSSKVVKVTVTAGTAKQSMDVALGAVSVQQEVQGGASAPSGSSAGPSLQDLGISPGQVRGSAQDQARLDKRSHMLQIHQKLGLIAAAPMIASLFTSTGAKGHHGMPGSATGRDVHAALGAATGDLYFTSAYFAIRAPKIPGTKAHGPIRVHKALAWIHGPGMILTPVLGAIAFSQESHGEKVHGIAKYHSDVAAVTAAAYGAAIISVSVKF